MAPASRHSDTFLLELKRTSFLTTKNTMYAEDRVPGSISDEIRSPTVFSDWTIRHVIMQHLTPHENLALTSVNRLMRAAHGDRERLITTIPLTPTYSPRAVLTVELVDGAATLHMNGRPYLEAHGVAARRTMLQQGLQFDTVVLDMGITADESCSFNWLDYLQDIPAADTHMRALVAEVTGLELHVELLSHWLNQNSTMVEVENDDMPSLAEAFPSVTRLTYFDGADDADDRLYVCRNDWADYPTQLSRFFRWPAITHVTFSRVEYVLRYANARRLSSVPGADDIFRPPEYMYPNATTIAITRHNPNEAYWRRWRDRRPTMFGDLNRIKDEIIEVIPGVVHRFPINKRCTLPL
jgi:hypothetical protein